MRHKNNRNILSIRGRVTSDMSCSVCWISLSVSILILDHVTVQRKIRCLSNGESFSVTSGVKDSNVPSLTARDCVQPWFSILKMKINFKKENEKKRQERKVKEAEMQERAKNKLEEERKALKRRVYVQENDNENYN